MVFSGGTEEANGCHGLPKVLGMPKTSEVVAERMLIKMVAQWWLEGGRMIVDDCRTVAEWRFSGCSMVAM